MNNIKQVYLLDVKQSRICRIFYRVDKSSSLMGAPNNDAFISQIGIDVTIQPKHLYFTSDIRNITDVKVGDKVIQPDLDSVVRTVESISPMLIHCEDYTFTTAQEQPIKKIVATTNPDLYLTNCKDCGGKGDRNAFVTAITEDEDNFDFCTRCNGTGKELSNKIAKIGDDFIEAYIKAYNEGKPITEVNLEYVYSEDNGLYYNSLSEQVLKLRSNGTVIISPVVEKLYTKDEVLVILKCFASDCESDEDLICYQGLDNKGFKKFTYLENWFEQNYPQ